MSSKPGRREQNKRRTRVRIVETARRLFAERGFDAVTVLEVARTVGVSEGTVFNYFPAKEDLFYDGMQAFETLLAQAIRERPTGESLPGAFRGFVLESTTRLAAEEVTEMVADAARVIAESRALQTRERAIVARYTETLAALIAEETGAGERDLEPWAVASALMGVQQGLVDYIRAAAVGGRRGPTLAEAAEAQAEQAFALLETGLRGYAIRAR